MAELTCEVLVQAEPSTIFALLTQSDMQSWLGTDAELDARTGGVYKINVVGKHPALGEFVEVIPNEKLVFTFGWDEPGHPIPAGSTKVAITLIPEGSETRVRLVHSGLPDDAIADHTGGWTTLLNELSFAASGGTSGSHADEEATA
jgi:uncharacterized protein YndB with AHSA1/START domain